MRLVGRYRFSSPLLLRNGSPCYDFSADLIERWLKQKGQGEPGASGAFRLNDGRAAVLRRETIAASNFRAASWSIDEPIAGGTFSTRVSLAQVAERVEVALSMHAGQAEGVVAPFAVDARCPRIVRDLIDQGGLWTTGGMLLRSRAVKVYGAPGGRQLVDAVRDTKRHLPVIVLSEQNRFLLEPNLPARIASDLAGLSAVFHTDEDASWELTHSLGQEWSCFNGAIRVYWPGAASPSEDHRRHPLWTAARLLGDWEDPRDAADFLRHRLRALVLPLSTYAFKATGAFEEVVEAARKEDQERRRLEAEARNDGTSYLMAEAVKLEGEIATLRLANAELIDERDDLRRIVENLKLSLNWSGQEPSLRNDSSPPESDREAARVSDAVDIAKERFARELVFGADVERGIKSLDADAGPPGKILVYLKALAGLSTAMKAGALGTNILDWLRGKGICCSQESESIRRDADEMRRRIFHDGDERRQFDLHLKPNDSTTPGKCVRIYCDWDAQSGKVRVGWVGRHP